MSAARPVRPPVATPRAAAPDVATHAATHAAPDVVVLLGALALALLPLVPVYGTSALARPVLGGLALGTAVALAAVRWQWGRLVTAAVAVLTYLVAGAALAVPDTAVLGVLPGPASMLVLLTGAITVWKEVLTLEPVLGPGGGVLVAPYGLALGGAVLAVATARGEARSGRHTGAGAGAAVVPLAVLALALLLGTKESVAAAPAGVLLPLTLMTWVAWRRGTLAPRRVVAAVLMASVAAIGGALAGPLVAGERPRFVLRDELVPPFDPRDQASPLSAFRTYVKDWQDTPLLTVRGLPEQSTVRLATLDGFDGVVWNVAGTEAAEGSGRFREVGETITTVARGDRTTVEIEVHELFGVWLPTVGYAEEIDFEGPEAGRLARDLRYNDATGAAVLTGGVPDGARWTADVVVPVTPDDDVLGAAAAGSVRLPEPEGVPDAVALFAGEIAGTASSPVLIARSLEAGLADRGWFSHGLAGDHPSLSGHGADRLTTLLTGELMVGDGEQYASAMALMAREMGLPSRVVLGFRPDEERRGDPAITFTGDDIAAWVEVNIEGHGWVSFFPTPDESRTPDEETPQQRSQPQPQVRQPPPPPAEPVTPPDDDTEQPRTEDTREELPVAEPSRLVLLVGIAVAVPLGLTVTPLLIVAGLKRRRRHRRRTTGDPVSRVTGGWDELLDQARDLSCPAPPAATRREIAVSLSGAFATATRGGSDAVHSRAGEATSPATRPAGITARSVPPGLTHAAEAPLVALADRADATVFGAGDPTVADVDAYWAQVDRVLAAMHAAVPRRQRWRARWSAASLRARPRAPRRSPAARSS